MPCGVQRAFAGFEISTGFGALWTSYGTAALFDSKPLVLLFEVQAGSIINCKCIVYLAGLNLTENTFSLRIMKGVGVQSGFDYFSVSVNNRPEWTSTAVGKISHCRLKSKVPLKLC